MTTHHPDADVTIRLDSELDDSLRATLAGLADVLIPAAADFPSASQAGVSGDLTDQVLQSRPDLLDGLVALLERAQGKDPVAAVAELRERDPAGFSVLATVVPGAYFSSPEVRARLGYHGQSAKPLPPADLDAELLRSVIKRGPIYRPTPDLHLAEEGQASPAR